MPASLKTRIHAALDQKHYTEFEKELRALQKQAKTLKAGDVVDCFGHKVRINDPENYVTLIRDIFFLRIYHFETKVEDPLIIDCGSNIGMSILYFKNSYPGARVIGFEPDPPIFNMLTENVNANNLTDVQLINAALAAHNGSAIEFYCDGKYGSYIGDLYAPSHIHTYEKIKVSCVPLKAYLTEPVSFLKMNIEGAECEVLLDCGESLRMIDRMVIEYHHLPGLPRTLHIILRLLHDLGFEYLINDFSSDANPAVTPPFQLSPDSKYFLLLYAQRSA